MAKMFFGLRFPNKEYEFLQLNVDLNIDVSQLKDEISKKINYTKDEIQLIYCGNILDDNEKISDTKITQNSTIHVIKKTTKPKFFVSNSTYSDEDCQRIANLFGTVTGTQLSVQTRINILQKIINEYPELRRNLGAQALIRDSVLFHSLDKVEVIKKVAKNYNVICDAAEFIVKTTKKELAKNEIDTFNEELFSSSSSEEDNNSSNPNQLEQARIRRISRDQLAAALILAGSSSLNSLSNIAQRNSNLAEQQEREQRQNASTSRSTTTARAISDRINSMLLNNALTEAFLSAESSQVQNSGEEILNMMDTSESPSQNFSNANNQDNRTRYANQLQLMREMGLVDENVNIQALILSNGEVEAAVTLVLGGMNNLFN